MLNLSAFISYQMLDLGQCWGKYDFSLYLYPDLTISCLYGDVALLIVYTRTW